MPRVYHGFRDPRALLSLAQDVKYYTERIRIAARQTRSPVWTAQPTDEDIKRLIPWASNARARHLRSRDRRVENLPASPNDGFTVAVKDNIVTAHLPSSCASNILRGYVAPKTATVVKLMEEAGMAVVGKTNMDEFGMGSHNLHSAFGPLRQPYSRRSAGGSSGGSGLAVAMHECHMAIGTDTGGSVRLPAAYLGLYGFKPSYGRISRYGVVPYANSLDTVGILARNPLDVWLLYNILSKADPRDPTCLTEASRKRIAQNRAAYVTALRSNIIRTTTRSQNFTKSLNLGQMYNSWDSPWMPPKIRRAVPTHHRSRRLRRVGIPADYNIAELQPEVRNAWSETIALLSRLGHEIVPIQLPATRHALSAYYILAPAEASSNLAKYDGVRYGAVRDASSADADEGVLYSAHRSGLFGDEVKRRILLGAFSLSAGAMDNYFLQAQRVRRLVQDEFNQVFRMAHPLLEGSSGVAKGVDYILCPTAPTIPPRIDDKYENDDPLESYMNDVFTVPASLAGLPAYSFPAPPPPAKKRRDHMRKVGMQIIGQYGDDFGVMQFVKSSIWERVDWVDDHRWTGPTREANVFY